LFLSFVHIVVLGYVIYQSLSSRTFALTAWEQPTPTRQTFLKQIVESFLSFYSNMRGLWGKECKVEQDRVEPI